MSVIARGENLLRLVLTYKAFIGELLNFAGFKWLVHMFTTLEIYQYYIARILIYEVKLSEKRFHPWNSRVSRK